MKTRLAVLLIALPLLAGSPALAVTDWGIAAAAWKDQLAALYVADAARRFCGLPVSAAAKASMVGAMGGLEQALGTGVRARAASEKGLLADAGGRKAFCASNTTMAQARQTIEVIQSRVAATGGNVPFPQEVARSASVKPNMPTPVVDPDIALIRGCRAAAIARSGSARVDSNRFWTQYERCVADQGAGWY